MKRREVSLECFELLDSKKKPHQLALMRLFSVKPVDYLAAAAFFSLSLAITASATLFGQGA